MKYRHLLLEYNPNRINKEFGRKLVMKWMWDMDMNISDYRDWIDQEWERVGSKLIDDIAEADPSPTNEFTGWIVRLLVKGGINRYEDVGSRVFPALEDFMKLKRKKIPEMERDINKYKSLEQLEDVVEKYAPQIEVNDKEKERQFIQNNDVEILYNDNEIKVVSPKTEEASCYYGRNTRWCTASTRGNNYFDEYHRKGSLYIIIVKKKNQRYQFHFESGQFMDEKDFPVSYDDLVKLTDMYPVLKDIFNDEAIKYGHLEFIKNPNDLDKKTIQKIIHNHGPYCFKYWPEPTDRVKKIAVDQNPWVIRFIDDPSDKLQMISVIREPQIIKYIENPDRTVQLTAIELDYFTFHLIKNLDPVAAIYAAMITQNLQEQMNKIRKKKWGDTTDVERQIMSRWTLIYPQIFEKLQKNKYAKKFLRTGELPKEAIDLMKKAKHPRVNWFSFGKEKYGFK